jgi:hypothetical protein
VAARGRQRYNDGVSGPLVNDALAALLRDDSHRDRGPLWGKSPVRNVWPRSGTSGWDHPMSDGPVFFGRGREADGTWLIADS